MVLNVVGSSPTSHPNFIKISKSCNAGLFLYINIWLCLYFFIKFLLSLPNSVI